MDYVPIQCKQCNALNLSDAGICTKCGNTLLSNKKKSLWIGLVALTVIIFLPCFCCSYISDKSAQNRLNQPVATPNKFISNITNAAPSSVNINKSTKKVENKPKSNRSVLNEPTNNPIHITPKSSSRSSGYFIGPRDGCYTYSANGRKRYVDRNFCN